MDGPEWAWFEKRDTHDLNKDNHDFNQPWAWFKPEELNLKRRLPLNWAGCQVLLGWQTWSRLPQTSLELTLLVNSLCIQSGPRWFHWGGGKCSNTADRKHIAVEKGKISEIKKIFKISETQWLNSTVFQHLLTQPLIVDVWLPQKHNQKYVECGKWLKSNSIVPLRHHQVRKSLFRPGRT